jgi:hypothetical protein
VQLLVRVQNNFKKNINPDILILGNRKMRHTIDALLLHTGNNL